MDVGLIYGVAWQTVYNILWEVIDAINTTPAVGPFRFPQTAADCKVSADKWQVCAASPVPIARALAPHCWDFEPIAA